MYNLALQGISGTAPIKHIKRTAVLVDFVRLNTLRPLLNPLNGTTSTLVHAIWSYPPLPEGSSHEFQCHNLCPTKMKSELNAFNHYVQRTVVCAFSTAVKSYFQTEGFWNCMNAVVVRLVTFTAAEEETVC